VAQKSKPLSRIIIKSYEQSSTRLHFSQIFIIKWAQEYYMFVLNTLCTTQFVTSSVAVFEAPIWVKSMYMIKSQQHKKKKEKIWKLKKCIHNSPSNRRFWNKMCSLLMRAEARGGADTIYCMWRISLLCGPGIVSDVTKVGHAQNIYYQRIVL